jgi:isoaspartyl peptidase/L-asparaginase-like protein (Ntn-hydrolase superfamily)/imidazolonepropionase-like amidohydrolase
MFRQISVALALACLVGAGSAPRAQAPAVPGPPAAATVTVLHAAHLLDVERGTLIGPGEILVRGTRIAETGTSVTRPPGATVLNLGEVTLMPGLIDAHVHLFLHPGSEDMQTIVESVPQRTILALQAARADLLAGFTAERDMGTEGAGSADTAVRNAIDAGLVPGPRLRISGNAIDILGGHEDAIAFNPAGHISSNATYANNATELVAVIRQQAKEGADFAKIYQTGPDRLVGGQLKPPYQYTEAELQAAVQETARLGTRVAVHATGEPGALYAARAGVASIDHAYQLSPETMRLMRDKQIYAVPTFAITEYFAAHAETPAAAERRQALQALHAAEFRQQLAAGVPMAVGSDVGPFPHGDQAREYELMVQYGMSPADVLRAGLLHGARLLGWEGAIGQLKPGYLADIIAVPGDPLRDISILRRVNFVMKDGTVWRNDSGSAVTTSPSPTANPSRESGNALSPPASGPHPWALVIHGGAGVLERSKLTPETEANYRAGLQEAIQAAAAVLDRGGASLDAVETAIKLLEDNPVFNAGRGAVFAADGTNQLDAAIMDGASLKAGSVAGVQRTRHPISLARAVMEHSPHVMLVGAGADAFAAQMHLEQVPPSFFFTEKRWQDLVRQLEKDGQPIPPRPKGAPPPPAKPLSGSAAPEERHYGTVGVVALDRNGNLAAGTSTGGMVGKRWNRVGDSPLIGAGTYAANQSCAVSATGTGEYFIRLTVARTICALVQYQGLGLQAAADEIVQHQLVAIHGDGGVIALAPDGQLAWSFNTPGMLRARVKEGEPPQISIYRDEP